MKVAMPAANASVCPTCRCVFVVSEKRNGFYERMNPNHCPNCGARFLYFNQSYTWTRKVDE